MDPELVSMGTYHVCFICFIKKDTYFIYYSQRLFPSSSLTHLKCLLILYSLRDAEKREISAKVVISIMSVNFYSLTHGKEISRPKACWSDQFSNSHHQKKVGNELQMQTVQIKYLLLIRMGHLQYLFGVTLSFLLLSPYQIFTRLSTRFRFAIFH